MKIEYLVKMANQIGVFFRSEAIADVAARDIAGHLKRFWDPRMREQIVAHVETHAGEGLDPLVLTAIRAHRASLCGSPIPIGAEPRWAGPPGVSDAG